MLVVVWVAKEHELKEEQGGKHKNTGWRKTLKMQ
jgi:hypothetical protein